MISGTGPDSRALTDDNFRHVCELVYKEAAIVLGAGKEYLVEARLTNVAARHRFASLNAFVDHIRFSPTSGPMQREIVDALTTNETMFFRDFHPFEALKRDVFPVLLNKKRGEKILIWSAACSSGQEPYSIAMMLADAFPAQADSFQIIATDISTNILRRAPSGIYQQIEVNRGLPAAHLVKHFTQIPEGWQISEQIRRRVEFREINLSKPWGFLPRFDLVLIRNVMIYFDMPTRRQILGRVRDSLLPGGYMLLGGAETTLMVDAGYTPITLGKSTFYKLNA